MNDTRSDTEVSPAARAIEIEKKHEADLRTLKRRLLGEADKRRDQAQRANEAEGILADTRAKLGIVTGERDELREGLRELPVLRSALAERDSLAAERDALQRRLHAQLARVEFERNTLAKRVAELEAALIESNKLTYTPEQQGRIAREALNGDTNG